LAPLLRLPLVFTAQGELTFDALDVLRRSTTMRLGLRRMLRVADAVTGCSAFVLDGLRSLGPLRDDAVVIPNGVNPEDFHHPSSSDAHSDPYVLAVGRLVPQKGFDVLVDAFASPLLSGLQLRIAGEGAEGESLRMRASELGIADRVKFLGPVGREELPRMLAGARVFALPSRSEPFGIALLEAMAAGVPSVATRSGGVVEFARDGETALLVDVDDSENLASAISALATNTDLRARLSAEGRRTAWRLSWSAITEQYEALYNSLQAT
jgi:glycogen synthase